MGVRWGIGRVLGTRSNIIGDGYLSSIGKVG